MTIIRLYTCNDLRSYLALKFKQQFECNENNFLDTNSTESEFKNHLKCNNRSCLIYEKCNVPDGIRSKDLSYCKTLLPQLAEVAINLLQLLKRLVGDVPVTETYLLFML